jgi:lipopolysaccharide export system protein LptA
MTPNNFRVKNGLTVANGVTISAGNIVITSGQLVIGATAINATSMSDGANNAYSNAVTFAANASNANNGTLAFARLPSQFIGTTTIQSTSAAQAVSGITTLATGNTTITGFANVTSTLQVGGVTTFSGNVVLGSVGVSANGGFGTAGQVLSSNGTAAYWTTAAASGVTSIATANGLSGGPITSTGTIQVTTGPTLTVNTTGIHVNSALSIADLTLSGNLTVSGGLTTLSANLVMANNTITSPGLKAYKEFVSNVSVTTTTQTLDLATTNIFNVTMANNCTFTFSNPPAAGTLFSFMVILTQDATGSRTATWPAAVKYPNESTPTLTTTANKVDILNFITVDGGTSYFGALSMANV